MTRQRPRLFHALTTICPPRCRAQRACAWIPQGWVKGHLGCNRCCWPWYRHCVRSTVTFAVFFSGASRDRLHRCVPPRIPPPDRPRSAKLTLVLCGFAGPFPWSLTLTWPRTSKITPTESAVRAVPASVVLRLPFSRRMTPRFVGACAQYGTLRPSHPLYFGDAKGRQHLNIRCGLGPLPVHPLALTP